MLQERNATIKRLELPQEDVDSLREAAARSVRAQQQYQGSTRGGLGVYQGSTRGGLEVLVPGQHSGSARAAQR